jgi:ribosomal protein L40E
MIICTGCGHTNGADDTFCGSCGGFLEWDGEPAPAQRPAPSRAATVMVPAPRTEPDLSSAPADAAPEPLPARQSELPAREDFSVRVPQAEHERPAPMRPDPVDLGRADLYCGECGAGNAAGRFFCRRCGASLEDALPAEHLSW